QIERGRHNRDKQKIDDPQSRAGPAERQEHFRRNINARRAAPWFEILYERLHPFDDADRRQREERAAQAQNAEAENKRERAHADAGGCETQSKRPAMRIDEPDADIAAEPEE